jgi:hypothetical protein
LTAACLCLASVACTPLYLPPVPERLPPLEARLRLRDVRIDHVDQGNPSLVLVPREVPTPGWMAVSWYPPTGAAVAENSVWLDADRVGHAIRVPFPDHVSREPAGRWRAVLTFDGRVLRQVEWKEPAGR